MWPDSLADRRSERPDVMHDELSKAPEKTHDRKMEDELSTRLQEDFTLTAP